MDRPFNPLSQAPANEFAPEDVGMVNAFFESSKFRDQSLHQQYVERCRPKSHSLSARTSALRALLEHQQDQPLGDTISVTDLGPDKLIQSASPTTDAFTTLPRRRAIKRRRHSLRLTVESMKRSLLKQHLAKQVHKQSLRSTEAIVMNALGPAPQSTIFTNNEPPGVHILPTGLQTEDYKTWCRAREDLAELMEAEKGPVRHFVGQAVLLIVKFPILLSPRIKAKLRATGGILAFNNSHAAVFCTILSTPLECRKFITTLSKLCSIEHHQFMTVFAGNRYLCSGSPNGKLDFTAIQQKKLGNQIICSSLRLDVGSDTNKAVASSIEKAIVSSLE